MRRIFALAAAAALLGGAQEAASEPVGFVAVSNGDVKVQQAGAWKAAERDGGVEIGDTIRTGSGASAKIVLVDDTLLQIDEETELRIETWHIGDAATKEISLVRQVRGRLRATVGDAFGGSTKMEVHIPTAAIGIKGTDFEVISDSLWEACLHSGGIDVSNAFGSASPKPGECVYAYGDKAPGDPHPNSRQPLAVEDDEPGDPNLAHKDFSQPIQVDVGSGPPGPGGPGQPDGDGPYGVGSGENDEDELQQFEAPELEPIEID